MYKILTKQYEIILHIKKRFIFIPYTKKIKLKFEQAKLIDVLEFMEITNKHGEFGIIIWLLKFIEKFGKKISKSDRLYIMGNWENVFNKIKETFFEGCFTNKKQNGEEAPFSSYITILSEKLHIEPLKLIKEYTPNQLEFLSEGLIWNVNETTKEGQKKNRLWLIQNKAMNRSEEEKEKIRKILDSIRGE